MYDDLSTGDILIYSCSNYFSNVVKLITSSEYNHVTIVLRLDSSCFPKIKILKDGGDLFVLESITNLLNLFPETYTFKIKKLDINYSKIMYRKLKNIYKTPNFYTKLINYLQSNVVEIHDSNKIVKDIKVIDSSNEKIIPIPIENSRYLNNYTSAFCSNLSMGFYNSTLNLNIEIFNYYPGDFLNHKLDYIFESPKLLEDQSYDYNIFLFIFTIILIIILLIYFTLCILRKYR